MYVFKRGEFYWYEFEFRGERIRKSAKVTNAGDARTIGAAHRTRLAKGEVGINDPVASPTLKAFLENDYRPYMESRFTGGTVLTYDRGIKWLSKSDMGELRINEITNQHAARFIAQHPEWKAAGTNTILRLLVIALRLAVEWGKLAAAPRIKMVPKPKGRTRVLSQDEQASYLAACGQPWKDIATVMLNTGMRPKEVRGLQWKNVDLDARTLQITRETTKTDSGVRRLPLTDAAYNSILARWQAQGEPKEGWLFPSPYNEEKPVSQAYEQHNSAIKASGVKPFVVYTMRHTALTMLAEAGVDAFVIKTIAGHTSIATTQKYVHPQAEAVANAFVRLGTLKTPHTLKLVESKREVKPAA